MGQYYKPQITPEDKAWIGVIALIMKATPGPKTKAMLATELNDVFTVSPQEMMNKIAFAILLGKKNGRFKAITNGSWELREK
jgi:hypothetical protein